MSLLLLVLLLPLLGALILLFLPSWEKKRIRVVALVTTLTNFFLSLLLWLQFDNSCRDFQFKALFSGSEFLLGIDGISLFFVILTCFLFPACILVGWVTIQDLVKEYCLAFLLLETLLLAFFSVTHLLLFYVFFESVLIPMFLIIGIWGSRERRMRAAMQFFLYTLAGSVLMLFGILLVNFQGGTLFFSQLSTLELSQEREILLWLMFFASFAVKVPMIPVHIWLPEAHVEAPTAGSVVLAGVLLKLASYGFCRISIPLFPSACLYFTPFIFTLSCLAIIYTSLTTLRQVDLKKIIAYSSIAHMNFVTLGLFTLNTQGIEGSIILMISHGFVSPALFLLIGALYDRHKTRLLFYFAGCALTMPLFATFFLLFTMANCSLPGSSSFPGEFLIINACFQGNTLVALLSATGMVSGAAYSLWLCNRLIYGLPKETTISFLSDLSRREFSLLFPFAFAVLWLGFFPEPLLNSIHCSVLHLIEAG